MKHNYIGRIAAGNLLEDNASVAGCIPYNDRAAHRLHNKPPTNWHPSVFKTQITENLQN
jgi:hypothetical protein